MPLPMKFFLVIVLLSFSIPASAQTLFVKNHNQDTDCKGVIHGVVSRLDGKPWGGVNLILEPVGDYDYVLPRTKTDEQGEYRFSDVTCGNWGVFVEDKDAGYPHAGRILNWALYGRRSKQVRITKKNLEALLNVTAPPRPAQLRVRAIDSKTKAEIACVEVQLKVTRKREIKILCPDSEMASREDYYFLVPPDQNVKLHITSKAFHEWKESAGRGKAIRVPTGEILTINVELEPIQN